MTSGWLRSYRMLPDGFRRRLRHLWRHPDVALNLARLAAHNRLVRHPLGVDDGTGPIVSLTTYPPRLHSVYLAIESIFNQTVPPAAVYLWLYKGEIGEANIPPELKRLRRRGLQIEFVPENPKAAKKLVYAVRRFPHRPIVTADDDVIYPPDWLGRLLAAHAETPDFVVCHRGHTLVPNGDRQLMPYNQCINNNLNGAEPSFNLLPTGVGGVLYPAGCLDERVHDLDLMERLCPTADDVWFKAMALLRGVPSRRVAPTNFMPTPMPSNGETLFNINKMNNDQQIAAAFGFFDLYMKLLPNHASPISSSEAEPLEGQPTVSTLSVLN